VESLVLAIGPQADLKGSTGMNAKKTAMLAAALLALSGSAVAQAATSSTAALQREVTYQLVDVQTGKCATVAGGRSTANNVRLVQYSCDTDPSRSWSLRVAG
jgi:hypothetical protein